MVRFDELSGETEQPRFDWEDELRKSANWFWDKDKKQWLIVPEPKLNANCTPSEFGSKTTKFERVVDSEKSEFTETQISIEKVCDEIKAILVEKNRKYGNSALEPVRVFSDSPPDEQIRVRIDDKISRLRSGQVDDDEDVLLDLIGYLTLLIVYRRQGDACEEDYGIKLNHMGGDC